MRWLLIGIALLAAPAPAPAATSERPAQTMRDLRSHFATCFQPAHEQAAARITFYFSVKSDGEIFGRPRLVLSPANGSSDAQESLASEFQDAFRQCLPLELSKDLARTIPGKVYFLQFSQSSNEPKDVKVVLRPYGSMGYPLVDAPGRFW